MDVIYHKGDELNTTQMVRQVMGYIIARFKIIIIKLYFI